jgi:hypothetical protein
MHWNAEADLTTADPKAMQEPTAEWQKAMFYAETVSFFKIENR